MDNQIKKDLKELAASVSIYIGLCPLVLLFDYVQFGEARFSCSTIFLMLVISEIASEKLITRANNEQIKE